jgi:hypothetical protein
MSRDVHSCTNWLRPRNSPPPPPAFGLALRGRYWSATIDDISLEPPVMNAPPGELAGSTGPGNRIEEEAVRTIEADSARGQAPEELRSLVGVAVEAVRQPLAHVPLAAISDHI